MSPLTYPIRPDLTGTLRALKLGKLTATLPERLTLARQTDMPHADFLQLILADEVARREAGSIALRAKNAGLEPAMRTETWDTAAAIRYDQRLWNELVSLRFLDGAHGALIWGPSESGKHSWPSRWATSPSAAAALSTWPAPTSCSSVSPPPACTTPCTTNTGALPPLSCSSSIFALQPLTPAQTTDFYEVITERHRRASTVVTSNRDASEWLPLMTDPLLAQSAIDRLTSTCHELVVEVTPTAAASAPPRPQLTTRPQRHHDAHVTRPGGP